MSEILEEASRCEMAERESAVSDQLARTRAEAKRGADREAARAGQPAICADCSNKIPAARRQAVPGCLRCIACERARSVRIHR